MLAIVEITPKETVYKLELRFGVENVHQMRVQNRRQMKKESVQALAADVWSMTSLAY